MSRPYLQTPIMSEVKTSMIVDCDNPMQHKYVCYSLLVLTISLQLTTLTNQKCFVKHTNFTQLVFVFHILCFMFRNISYLFK